MVYVPKDIHENTQLAARAHVAHELTLSLGAVRFEDAYADIEVNGNGWIRFLEILTIIRPDEETPLCMYEINAGRPCIRNAGHPSADQRSASDGGHRARA